MKILTTNKGTVRFNPNFYADGKVCVSMLGTFGTITWSPILTIEKILYAVSSLMTENPYHNEPGQETCNMNINVNANCKLYAAKIRHETIRVAIIYACKDIMANNQMYFNQKYLLQKYLLLIEECNQMRETYPDYSNFYVAHFEHGYNMASGQFMFGMLIQQLIELENEIQTIPSFLNQV